MAAATAANLFEARQAKLFNIGHVLAELNKDFEDLSPSKLRFLEEQGLVSPQRTASGYRKFTQLDIERIRIVLELQRDQYLPLKVIRSYLADLDAAVFRVAARQCVFDSSLAAHALQQIDTFAPPAVEVSDMHSRSVATLQEHGAA